jgi:hypothetical protein
MSPQKVSDVSDKRLQKTKANMHVRPHRLTLGRSEVSTMSRRCPAVKLVPFNMIGFLRT